MDNIKTAIQLAGKTRGSALGDTMSRRLWFLDSESLSATARRRTGLKDFGDPPIEPALSILTRSLEQEADLHPLGRFLMRVHLRGLLETRLKLANAWSKESTALDASSIRRPVFITGMPRSGSTFLHELLMQDPENRAPKVWEVMFPVPAPEVERSESDSRIRKAAACLWCFRRLAPGADSAFPMRARTPHECVAIHSYTLLSEEFVSTGHVPTYEAFLRSANLIPTYAWQKRFLQHLQLPWPAKQWVLKSPDHVRSLEGLFAVFPDAVIIHMHRNPLEVLRSSAHLTEVLRGLFARTGDRNEIGAREARMLAEGMERVTQFRDTHPELASRFIDVKYPELVADALAVVRRIYREIERPLTETAIERMNQLAANRSRYQGGHRKAERADLGFDGTAEEARRFEPYCSRFGIPYQQVGRG